MTREDLCAVCMFTSWFIAANSDACGDKKACKRVAELLSAEGIIGGLSCFFAFSKVLSTLADIRVIVIREKPR